MKKSALFSVLGLLAVASSAQAVQRYNNALPTCEELGYAKHDVTPKSQALFCPFDNSYSVIMDSTYRGFVEKSQLDADYAAYGKPEDFCELETRTQGEGSSKHTLYRCKKCKTLTYEAGLCVEFCDVKKFPYSSRPEDLYGTVIECRDNNGSRYAYTSCNNGWKMDANGVRCDMEVADRYGYPYLSEPDKERGVYTNVKSATNLYYAYKKDSCNSGYEFKNYNDSYETGICVKTCAISNCRLDSTDTNGLQNYKCDIPEDCTEGDSVYFNNVLIGMLWHKADSRIDRNLIVGPSVYRKFGMQGYHFNSPSYDNGKLNTKKILEFCNANNVACPAVEYCLNYSVSGVTEPALAKGQWYLGSRDELSSVFDMNLMYVYAILKGYDIGGVGIMTSHSCSFDRASRWVASQNFWWVCWGTGKSDNAYMFPMLSI